VTTTTRNEFLPQIPTVSEFVPGYDAQSVQGFAAPKGTPPEIIERLNKEINAGLATANLKARFADLGASVFPVSPAEFGKFMADDTEKWGKVVKFSGAKAE
jgi:tripartite-type tricarboxylate transporter receptor subunit TctC